MVVLAGDRDALGVEGERVQRRAHRALDRVLERDQCPVGLAERNGHHRVVDGHRGLRLDSGSGTLTRRAQRVVREGSGGPEKGDGERLHALSNRRSGPGR